MNDHESLNFADVLASTMHDTKNSLGMLYNTIEDIMCRCQENSCVVQQEFSSLQHEIKRLSNGMIRLLCLYKAQKERLMINMDLHCVSECLEEAVAQNAHILASKGIAVELDCPGNLFWAFDYHLVLGVIDSVLNNAYRYTRDQVAISATREASYLVIRVADNGAGYPQEMIIHGKDPSRNIPPVVPGTVSTGLGLYFSSLVAKSHSNKGVTGFISTMNGGTLGGGQFSLYLP
jgi:two-component system, OmpR family, sensor histidine kinase SenX3